MNTLFWILPLALVATHPALARTQISSPGSEQTPVLSANTVVVMGMGQIEAIDTELKRIRINGMTYVFSPATRFLDIVGNRAQATKLKVGDWVNFWMKSGSSPGMPSLDQIALLPKP